MYISFKNNDKNLIVYLSGELDHHSSQEVREKIDDKIDEKSLQKVILDFSEVTFMDSSGIGVLIGRYKKLSMKDAKLCVINLKESVKRVFELSGMLKIIKVYNNLEEALEQI